MSNRAHAVIGANYGDEGKGLMTDYLCSELQADVVVRFNGGAQAGHTVVQPDGERHVFHHLGAGSFLGIPTFLSRYFIVNPILYWQEGFAPSWHVYAHPDAVVTLPWDMLINQALCKVTGHGSCGVGINETVTRSLNPRFRITVADMNNRSLVLRCLDEYFPERIRRIGLRESLIPGHETDWEEIYFQQAELFEMKVRVLTRPPRMRRVVFEGAQGLMLDQKSPDFPYVTHSNTGLKNVKQLCDEWDIRNLHATYVTRSYLTRHGAGPLPNEEPVPEFVKDATNIDHPFQGTLRYAPLDVLAMERRIIKDAEGAPLDIAITCNDQHEADSKKFSLPVAYKAWGPTRLNVHDASLV